MKERDGNDFLVTFSKQAPEIHGNVCTMNPIRCKAHDITVFSSLSHVANDVLYTRYFSIIRSVPRCMGQTEWNDSVISEKSVGVEAKILAQFLSEFEGLSFNLTVL